MSSISFDKLPKDKCVFQTARFEGSPYCLVSLGKNIKNLNSSDLICNDLLFDMANLNGIPISCGFKKILELGERPDICTMPPILNNDWRIIPISKEDVFISISKYNGKILIREAHKFPNDFCPVKLDYIKQNHPILWSFLSDERVKTLYFSIILVWRESLYVRETAIKNRELKLIGIVDNNTGELKSQEAIESWSSGFDLTKITTVESKSRDLITKSTALYKNTKYAINGSAILSISDAWYCELMTNSANLDDIDKLISLWTTYKLRDFKLFSDKIKMVYGYSEALNNLNGAFKSLSFLSSRLYEKINEISDKKDKIEFVTNNLPHYLQPMGWAIIKNENINTAGLKFLYSNLIKIHSGRTFSPKYC